MANRPTEHAPLTLTDLVLDPLNANRGTPRGRRLLQASLAELGAGRSILIDREGRVIAGNKTVIEARTLNLSMTVVPTDGSHLIAVQRTDVDLDADPRGRRLAVGDNRIAELDLDWDPEMLTAIRATGTSLDDLFSDDELERLLGHGLTRGESDDDEVLEPPVATEIVGGDLFVLGAHRIMCGDATDPGQVQRLLQGDEPVLMVTDPPYGVGYDPAWRHEIDPHARTAVGRVTNDHQVEWDAALQHFPGPVAYVWHAGLHAGPVAASLARLGFVLRAQIIWVKQLPVFSRGAYHWQHEPCWYAVRAGEHAHWSGDRTQTTVWNVPNLNPFGGSRAPEDAPTGHSTQKPVALFERPILNHTARGDLVFDPFLGSGTTLIAAEKTGRGCRAMELDPRYIQVAVERWERFTGRHASKA
jgi:DNA modification methylase